MFADYARYDALGLAELVRRREVSAAELLETAIAGLERLNPQLNCVTTPIYELARAQTRAGLPDGPFTGVPFLLKDLGADYAGVPTTWGATFRTDLVPAVDSELVARHKRAGLVIFGKTAVPELAMTWAMASRLFGVTRNPWDLARNPGISSGGAAAAVAARIVPIAHGNDGGGSLRVPASCTGTFGLKPTRGRNPFGPVIGDAWMGMAVDHAISRSVRDSAALLDATAGIDVGAFYNAPPKAGPFLAEVGRDPGRLRIALCTSAPYGAATHPDCLAAAAAAAKLCGELGHHIEEAAWPLPADGWQAFETFLYCEYAAGVADDEVRLGRKLGPADFDGILWDLIEHGRRIPAVAYAAAVKVLHRIARNFGAFFERYDALLTPTMAVPPVAHDHFDMTKISEREFWQGYLGYMPYTHAFNIAGSPAMSVPLYWSAEGLPIGVQFATKVASEPLLLRLAGQLESARPWEGRIPPHSFRPEIPSGRGRQGVE
ncbi:MAG: amidase [Alphaproteobacteria bacterium]|nr:amidase [Alphaproteobacteria bacterium]